MKRQVIQNFLNLPGISGVALVDGRNRPCFLGLDTSLNSHQQEALAQGMQQVVETTPTDFESFAFRFTSQLAYIYKLPEGLILLVLTSEQLSPKQFRPAVQQFTATLREDLHNAVPNLRLMAGSVTLSGLGAAASPKAKPSPQSSPQPTSRQPQPAAASQGVMAASISNTDIVLAMNHLSDFAIPYMGKIIVANMWRSSRPRDPWLERFEIQKSGHFQIKGAAAEPLTQEQHQWIRDWVSGFISRGSRTIRDFSKLVANQGLPDSEKFLLLENKSVE
jgi:hypothetical protein